VAEASSRGPSAFTPGLGIGLALLLVCGVLVGNWSQTEDEVGGGATVKEETRAPPDAASTFSSAQPGARAEVCVEGAPHRVDSAVRRLPSGSTEVVPLDSSGCAFLRLSPPTRLDISLSGVPGVLPLDEWIPGPGDYSFTIRVSAPCPIVVLTVDDDGRPVEAVVRLSYGVAEGRRFKVLGTLERQSQGGEATFQGPCGSDARIFARAAEGEGSTWFTIEPGLGPQEVVVAARFTVELALQGAGGPVTGVLLRGGVRLPVSVEGREVANVGAGELLGIVESPGYAQQKVDVGRREGARGLVRVEIQLQQQAPVTLRFAEPVTGVWCTNGGTLEGSCESVSGSIWRCSCRGPALVASQRWDVASVVAVSDIEALATDVELPPTSLLCITDFATTGVSITPRGMEPNPLIALLSSRIPETAEPCFRVPRGQPIQVEAGDWATEVTASAEREWLTQE